MNIDNRIKNLDELPLSLTVTDIAKVLGISKQNAYMLCNSDNFPSVRVGRRIITPKLAFIKWMEQPK